MKPVAEKLPPIAINRKARFDYFIEERFEAGISLMGWEVKSMRAGKAQIAEAYVYLKNGEAFLFGAHLNPLNRLPPTSKPTRLAHGSSCSTGVSSITWSERWS